MSKTRKIKKLEAKLDRKTQRLREARNHLRKLERTLAAGANRQGSIFAPDGFPELPAIGGVRLSAIAAEIRYKDRPDVMLAEIAAGASVAGVFTTSRTRSAPVLWCEERIARIAAGNAPKGKFAIVVNSGNANAFTGEIGRKGVAATAAAAAKALGTSQEAVFVASTGVIGEPLSAERIAAKMDEIAAGLAPRRWEDAARAIMTTDAFPKAAAANAGIDGTPVSIVGFAKGAGMIAPDMATMLAFLFTDAAIDAAALQELLSEFTGPTFNSITVDSDTSTSDTLLLVATGRAGNPRIADPRDPRLSDFRRALKGAMLDLAHMVVKDGEGASKFAEIAVSGAKSPQAAKRIAMSIANSPLVKTALAGSDPNWGRIVAAVGKSGEEADRDALTIRFGDILVAEKGWIAPGYREADGAAHMAQREVKITVDVGVGRGKATVWTCDLGHDYVTCNADYRS